MPLPDRIPATSNIESGFIISAIARDGGGIFPSVRTIDPKLAGDRENPIRTSDDYYKDNEIINNLSPYQNHPPSRRRLIVSVVTAITGATLALVLIVLPAEHGIDLTGIGSALGLTEISTPPSKLLINEVVAGNENYRAVQVPAFGEPTPLPNPSVFQEKAVPPRSELRTIKMDPGAKTEIKTVLREGQMLLFNWTINNGEVYSDFHGHEPEGGAEYWVRYKEQQSGSGGSGSLVAPFSGEHGWFWLNYNKFPVVITLNIKGYYEDIIDYGQL